MFSICSQWFLVPFFFFASPPISSALSPSSVWRRFVNDNYGERLKIIEA